MAGSARQRILDRLRQGPATLKELARDVGLTEREAGDHLSHALRSLPAAERLRETPAECLGCGFVFRKRARLRAPGRCPLCRSERIRPAIFAIDPRV